MSCGPTLAPERAAANLQVRISELRKALRAVDEVRTARKPDAPGYLLRVEPDELDPSRFEQLAPDGRDDTRAVATRRAPSRSSIARCRYGADRRSRTYSGVVIRRWRTGATRRGAARRARVEDRRAPGLRPPRRDGGRARGADRRPTPSESASGSNASWPFIARAARPRRCAPSVSCDRTLVDQLGLEPAPALRALEAQILRHDPALGPAHASAAGRDRDFEPPPTRYVASGDVHIAYQVLGDGDRDVVFVPGLMSHVELAWEDPGTVAFYRRFASLGRLILFDKRDTGLSDRAPHESTLEERMRRRPGGDERCVVATGRDLRLLRGGADEHPVRRHLPRPGQRADPRLGLRPLVSRRRTTRADPARRRCSPRWRRSRHTAGGRERRSTGSSRAALSSAAGARGARAIRAHGRSARADTCG